LIHDGKIAGAIGIGVSHDTNGTKITDNVGKADIFMRHFGSAFTKSHSNITEFKRHFGSNIKCNEVSFAPGVVLKVLRK